MILFLGRTALVDKPLCGIMLLSEVKRRSLTWCCICAIGLASALGHSLHQLAGVEHGCDCSPTSDSVVSHLCRDTSCPFDGPAEETDRSCHQSADGCSICHLLAHLGNGFFHLDVTTSELAFVGREISIADNEPLLIAFRVYAPRGPPVVA